MSRRKNSNRGLSHARRKRGGAAIVEMAFILPVFFFLVYGIVEYGHAQMVANTLNAAARASARFAATNGVTTAECEAQFREVMGSAIDASKVTIMVKDASVYDTGGDAPSTPSEFSDLPDQELADAAPRQLFIVRATVDYNDVALIGMPFLQGVTLTGHAISRHE